MPTRKIVLSLSLPLVLLVIAPCRAKGWDVTELGAKGDKQTNSGPAIQAAIDKCTAAGGGTVLVPAGDYLCGQLNLKSNVTLHIEAGATLWVSPRKDDYSKGNRFLFAEGQSNITIEGRGTIHGTGEADLARRRTDKPQQRPDFRVGILELVRCQNVTIRVTVRYSDSWTFDLGLCENVVIDGVSILNNYYRVNADGIDPVSCKSVRISNCHIVVGDDCIVCKTREGAPCEDIAVTNCTIETIRKPSYVTLANISIKGNDLVNAGKAILLSEESPKTRLMRACRRSS
jgi:polygalacturonase